MFSFVIFAWISPKLPQMKVTITSLELKGPLKFFALSATALKIMKQMRSANALAFKKRGVWTKHYTMSLWKDEHEMKAFALSGAHLEAMKNSRKIAREIRTVTIDADALPDWNTARALLEKGKVLKF